MRRDRAAPLLWLGCLSPALRRYWWCRAHPMWWEPRRARPQTEGTLWGLPVVVVEDG